MDINYEKVELFHLKKQNESQRNDVLKAFNIIQSVLQSCDDPIPIALGLLSHLSHSDDIHSNLREMIDVATLLPNIGTEFEEARLRFNEYKIK